MSTDPALPVRDAGSKQDHPFSALTHGQSAFLSALCSVIVGVALAAANSNNAVSETLKRVVARVYLPIMTAGYNPVGQRSIAVLTVDDADLEHLGMTWPVPLDYYQRLFDRLVELEPRSIFLDVVFLDRRDEEHVRKLSEAACRARAAGIDVYLASLMHEDRAPSATEQQLFRGPTGSCIVPVAPNSIVDQHDRSTWEYPLVSKGVESPALAMACAPPRKTASPGQACPVDRNDMLARSAAATAPARTPAPMALVWPGGGSALTNEQIMVRPISGTSDYARSCRSNWTTVEALPVVGGFLGRLVGLADEAGIAVADYMRKPLAIAGDLMTGRPVAADDTLHKKLLRPDWSLPLCPYNQVVPVRAFQNVGFSKQELREAIGGKHVLIGTDFQSRGDGITSPIHGPVAGVHAHAMALDNLISFGGGYRRGGEFSFRELSSPASLFTLIAVGTLSIGLAAWSVWALRWKYSDGKAFKPPAATAIAKPLRPSPRPLWRRGLWATWLLVLQTATLGRRPRPPPAQTRRYRWGRPALAVGLAAVGVLLLFVVGDRYMRVGPLSMIEYLLFPLGLQFLRGGEAVARYACAAWKGSAYSEPKKFVAQWAVVDDDQPPR